MNSFFSENINDALECWESGGLVAIPTETVYGLGAPVNQGELIEKIFSYKERPFYDPLIVHISDQSMAKKYVREWNSLTDKLAKKFWPGPLTIVLPKNDLISDMITSGLPTVGIRCPNNKLTLELISKLGEGIAAPSANKFTKTSPTNKDHVFQSFEDNHLCILVSEESADVGIESTIISINQSTISLLRPGVITEVDIREALVGDDFKFNEGLTAFEEKVVIAPGQDSIHYRPSYPLELVEMKDLSEKGTDIEYIYLELDPYVTARKLYALMRSPLTSSYIQRTFVLPDKRETLSERELQVWQSLLNRLEKAGQWSKKS
ncbi:MAG: threonylcarbamoyl-AMP synthase [Bacteriovoracaceae bacterium]|nr:threonylcarbamoyl-AMP synthase [Bacteriovoracaceae bacterium]